MLRKGAWVTKLLDTLFLESRTVKRSNLQEEITRSLAVRGVKVKMYIVSSFLKQLLTFLKIFLIHFFSAGQSKYPHFNRIHYPENLLEYAFALYLKERKWTKIVSMQCRFGAK